MVVALLMHCSQSIGEIGRLSGVRECHDSLVAFGMEMPLAEVDCLIIESMSLWEPLGLCQRKGKDSKTENELRLILFQNA